MSSFYYINFNKKNPLKVKLKGENYDNNETYETKIEIIDIETDKAIYTDTKNITGKNINNKQYKINNERKRRNNSERRGSRPKVAHESFLIFLKNEMNVLVLKRD